MVAPAVSVPIYLFIFSSRLMFLFYAALDRNCKEKLGCIGGVHTSKLKWFRPLWSPRHGIIHTTRPLPINIHVRSVSLASIELLLHRLLMLSHKKQQTHEETKNYNHSPSRLSAGTRVIQNGGVEVHPWTSAINTSLTVTAAAPCINTGSCWHRLNPVQANEHVPPVNIAS